MPAVRTQMDPGSSLDASISPTGGSLETQATDGQSAGVPSPRDYEAGPDLQTVRTQESARVRNCCSYVVRMPVSSDPARRCRNMCAIAVIH